jgi:fructokinase
MGTGVGGGLVIDGRLHSGLHHIAGEWGHNVLEWDGPPCYCGKRGCIETFLSGPGFLADYQRLGGSEARSSEQIVALYRSGESFALRAVDRLLDRLGRALAQVINIVDPHTIVLGGGLSNIDELYEQGPAHIAKYVFNSELKTPIKRNLNGDSAGVLGAARLWDN